MTVLSVVQSAAPAIALDIPQQVFGNPAREMVEMRSLVNEVARQIADGAEWSALLKVHTITGDGVSEDFPLPADFGRMVKDARLWSTAITMCPLDHVLSIDDWLALENRSIGHGQWITFGGQMHIRPARSSGEAVKFAYQHCNLAQGSGGSLKVEFTDDQDTFVLPERILTLGVIWNWKQRKGLDYAEDLALYQDALSFAIGRDKGPGIIAIGPRRHSFAINTAWPMELG